ncbi:germinal center-associated signaling and motility protein [Heterocephalus glaber]|uniref:Germinal center-associated signaling and motility protein n=1 Tax=Heterocephalus glaber TaxID=10181 RepID=A0AAX6TK99_HETGA|nr:germinal center-associated signaling and motility protein [Heterocephalus glaber]
MIDGHQLLHEKRSDFRARNLPNKTYPLPSPVADPQILDCTKTDNDSRGEQAFLCDTDILRVMMKILGHLGTNDLFEVYVCFQRKSVGCSCGSGSWRGILNLFLYVWGQQDTQEMPWNLRLQNAKQRTARYAGVTTLLKDVSAFHGKGTTSSPTKWSSFDQQDGGNQIYEDEVCYVLINHKAPGRKPLGNSTEEEVIGELYENIPCKSNRPRESLGGTETEYSLLRVSATPKNSPCPEDEYELLIPSRVSSPSLQQPGLRMVPSETQSFCLQ